MFEKSREITVRFNFKFYVSYDPSYWLFPTLKFFIVKAPCLEKFKYYVCNNCLKIMNCAILVIKKTLPNVTC